MMSEVEVSKVEGIIKTLSELEENIDSLNEKVADMKKKLHIRSQNEIENLREKVKEDHHRIWINNITSTWNCKSRNKKDLNWRRKNLAETKKKIDTKFEATKYVVSSVLK